MKVTHNQLFPLTMSVYTPDYKITEQEIEFLKNVEVATEEDMEQHVHLSKNINILNTCPELKNIRDVMLSVAEEYKRDVLGISNQLAPLHNWLSKQYKGGHHHRHNHPSVLFNLVYYIHGSENAPLRIELGDYEISEFVGMLLKKDVMGIYIKLPSNSMINLNCNYKIIKIANFILVCILHENDKHKKNE